MPHKFVSGEFARRRRVKIIHNWSTRRDGPRARIFSLSALSQKQLTVPRSLKFGSHKAWKWVIYPYIAEISFL
jgi:hypothetical protein